MILNNASTATGLMQQAVAFLFPFRSSERLSAISRLRFMQCLCVCQDIRHIYCLFSVSWAGANWTSLECDSNARSLHGSLLVIPKANCVLIEREENEEMREISCRDNSIHFLLDISISVTYKQTHIFVSCVFFFFILKLWFFSCWFLSYVLLWA